MVGYRRVMRAYVAGVQHESSTFSPVPTPLSAFGPSALGGPAGGCYRASGGDDMGYGAFAMAAPAHGIEVVCGPWSNVQPSQPASAATWAAVRDAIVEGLGQAGQVDMVFLMLHGAQSAAGCDDCEGDLLERVRAVVGGDVAVGALLDLHANVTPAMVQHCDLLVACRQYPHVDYAERVEEMIPVLQAIARRQVRPVTACVRVPASGVYPTATEPMVSLVQRGRAVEARPGVLSASLVHGFDGADAPIAGACVLVTTDADPAGAEAAAWGLAKDFLAVITGTSWLGPGINDTLDEVWSCAEGPVVVADRGDNAGGGAASDSTYLLGPLLERMARDPLPGGAAVALVWDPVAVAFCHDAGLGGPVRLRIGGKAGAASGTPLDVEAEVTSLRHDVCQALFGQGPPREAIGTSAAIRVAGTDIVLNSERQQVFSHHVFTEHGIDPRARRLLVVKSTQHFTGGFAEMATSIIRCETPGTTSNDLRTFPYRRLRRPFFPLDPPATLTLEWLVRARPETEVKSG